MTVIIEFTLPSESFPFGQATNGDSGVRVQLEQLVPIKQDHVPHVWATGQGLEQFERHLCSSEIVEHVEALTRVGDSVLYSVEWHADEEPFLNGISDSNGTIIEGHGNTEWSFTVQFEGQDDLTRFHQFYQAQDFPLHVDRIYEPGEKSRNKHELGLTPEQRETLVLAVENGYFSVPRETKLDQLAEKLNITRQATSQRIRRGVETALRKSLVGLATESFDDR